MATTNLSEYSEANVPSAEGMRFGLVVSEWNPEITHALKEGAIETLLRHGADPENIQTHWVPGSFELPLGAQFFAEYTNIDAIICLGCVVRGGTPHFDYVCMGVTEGISRVMTKYGLPVIFGVLTTDNQQQAADRAGGIHGNKGDEAAITAIKMVALHRKFTAQ
ncbi:MAG: 6,7-dimethyl-8-ribityllumazine synthase [Bacteroidales bacterium]